MKHFLTSVFAAIVCIFLSVPVCSGDEAARNRKAIRIILTTTHNTPRLERSLGSDIKAYVCEDTGTIEVELYEVRQADICIIDSKDNTVDYCTTNGRPAGFQGTGMALTEEAPGVFSWQEAKGDNAYQTWELDEGWYGYLMKF